MLTLTQTNYLNLTVLTAMLPLCFAAAATTLAGLLSQDKWPGYVNDLIAIVFVILASIADVYLTGRLTGDIALIVGTVTATATLLLATSFEPLQKWTAILQKSILVFQESGFHLVAQQPTIETMTTKTLVGASPISPVMDTPMVIDTTNNVVTSTSGILSNSSRVTPEPGSTDDETTKTQFIKPITGAL